MLFSSRFSTGCFLSGTHPLYNPHERGREVNPGPGELDMTLQSKVAVVTGGGSGIGRATAESMAAAGAAVVIGNRNAAQGEEVAEALRRRSGRAIFHKTDVSRPE